MQVFSPTSRETVARRQEANFQVRGDNNMECKRKTPQLSLTGGAAGGRVSIVMGGGVTTDWVGKGLPGGVEAGGGDSGTPGVGNGVIGA